GGFDGCRLAVPVSHSGRARAGTGHGASGARGPREPVRRALRDDRTRGRREDPPLRRRRQRCAEVLQPLVSDEPCDLVIVGAGPAGLATAIEATKAGLRYEVLEKGALVNSIFHFPRNQVFFTTPELLEIGELPFVTPYEKPTRPEALRYYRRVVESYGLRLTLGEEVVGIAPRAG